MFSPIGHSWQNAAMQKPFDIEVVRRNLRRIMDARDVRPTSLSKQLGDSPSLVSDLLNKTQDTKLSTIYRLADALDVPVDRLLASDVQPIETGPKLYLKGEVAAGLWREAYEWAREDWQAATGRSDIHAPADERFFLRIVGDSMDELYPEGTLIECLSVFAVEQIEPGRRVVVVRQRDDGMMEATVKELALVDGRPWLRPRSRNPAHSAFAVDDPGEGIEEVRIIAQVVASVRPE